MKKVDIVSFSVNMKNYRFSDMWKKALYCLVFPVLIAVCTILMSSCQKTADAIIDTEKVVITHAVGYSEILVRPEANSVTLSLMFDKPTEVYCEIGTSSGNYGLTTQTVYLQANMPKNIEFSGLSANTRYYYRTRYRNDGSSVTFDASHEHTFHTSRSPGSSFVFTVESDEHLYDKKGVRSIYQICLANQANDGPDFMISLGDIFGNDHQPATITTAEIGYLHEQYRPFLGSLCHSVPLFVCLGNHEGENDYYMSMNPPENLAVKGTLSRKLYFPNPVPDGFYDGNNDLEPYGIGHPENYYSWTWGDALFVVLDVYRYENSTSPKPQGWDWTIGAVQYSWLKNILESSAARYKFVFAHHIRGQGRGGVTNAKLFEWGGYDQDSVTYSFDSKRPGWGKPIHKLFVDNNVTIFFQGHDHLFSHEVLNGVTYQEVPMPSDSTYQIGFLANSDAYISDVVGGTGHVRVEVSPTGVKVDFIQAYLPSDEVGDRKNARPAFTYTIN